MKIIDSTYTKDELYKVSEIYVQMIPDKQRKLLQILYKFEELFDITIGKYYTKIFDLDMNTRFKPFVGI